MSVLYDNEKRWETVTKSSNGIELGGEKIAAFENFIIISRHKAVTIYDKISKLAYTIDSGLGLPGSRIGGILIGGDSLWISAYTKSRRSVEISGVLRIKFINIRDMFGQLIQAKKDYNSNGN